MDTYRLILKALAETESIRRHLESKGLCDYQRYDNDIVRDDLFRIVSRMRALGITVTYPTYPDYRLAAVRGSWEDTLRDDIDSWLIVTDRLAA